VEETPIFGIPIPDGEDPPNGAEQITAVVQRVEEVLAQIEELLLKAPAAGNIIIVNGTGDPVYKAVTGDVSLSTGGVTAIGNEKVDTAKIANLAVGSGKLVDLAVTAAKLAEEAVETAKIKGLAVTESKLAALAVTTAKIAAEAVETGKIKNLAVTEAKLAAESVSESKLVDGAVSSRKFKPTTGVKMSTGLYTPEWEGKVSAAPIPGTTFELNPPVACKLIVSVMLNPRFNKVLSVLQPHVHWTKGVTEKEYGLPEMPSHSAERDVNMPYSWTVEVPFTAGFNNAVDLRSYATVESAGKLTLPIGAAGYHYLLVAT
jgi:hypothetical protein